jgi:hypothetical protein
MKKYFNNFWILYSASQSYPLYSVDLDKYESIRTTSI